MLLLAVVAGCAEQAVETLPVALAVVDEPLVESDATTVEDVAPEPDSATAESPEPRGVSAKDWIPPFPERTNLFQPPRFARRITQDDDDEGSADAVVLMGFADLGTPRVVLEIDGVVKPLAGGDEHGGVRVISIAPPRAVLQRGRTRWTASIE